MAQPLRTTSLLPLIDEPMSYFKNPAEKLFCEFATVLEESGQKVSNLNAYNLAQRIKAELQRLYKHDAIVKELGYSSFDNLVKSVKMRKAPVLSSIETFAKKYNLDLSFLQGIGDCWDKQGEGKDQLKIFASLEKKLNDQRKIVTEAYTHWMELVYSQTTKAGYSEEQITAEMREWHETLEEAFHNLSASEFWQKYKGNVIEVQLISTETPKPIEVPLLEARKYCEDFYPALLLDQAFSDPETIGTVPLERIDHWGTLFAKYMQISDQKEKRKQLYILAREIMTRVVHRKIHGVTADLSIEASNRLNQLLTLDEYNPYQTSMNINEFTQLDDIINEFTSPAS